MKRVSILLILILLLCACQPTPAEDIVINKTEGSLEQQISSAAAPAYDSEDITFSESTDASASAEAGIRLVLNVPEHVKEQFDGNAVNGLLSVEIDAETDVPNVAKIPVLRGHIVNEMPVESERLAKLLLGDGPYVLPGRDRAAYIQREMENYQAWISALDQMPYGMSADYDSIRRGLQQNLESFAFSLSHPDEDDYRASVLWDGNFSDLSEVISIGNGKCSFSLIANEIFTYRLDEYYLHTYGADSIRSPRNAQEESMLQSAASFADSLGFARTLPYSINCYDELTRIRYASETGFENGYYSFMLLPSYEGVPVYPYTTNHGSDTGMQEADVSYDAGKRQEQIFGTIYNGKVVDMQWNYPFRVTSVENKNISLLSFDEIMDIFRRQVFMNQYLDKGYDKTLHITDIHLSYMRVKIRDTDEYYLLPVWDFMGYDAYSWTQSMSPGELASHRAWWTNQSILTINAIDGSIMSRNLGY